MEIIVESSLNDSAKWSNCIGDCSDSYCGCDDYNCGCDSEGDGGNDCSSYNPSYDDCLMGA